MEGLLCPQISSQSSVIRRSADSVGFNENGDVLDICATVMHVIGGIWNPELRGVSIPGNGLMTIPKLRYAICNTTFDRGTYDDTWL